MNIPVKDEVKKNIHIKIEKWFQEKYPAFQIMDELKYYRIFDSGQSKWVWFEI